MRRRYGDDASSRGDRPWRVKEVREAFRATGEPLVNAVTDEDFRAEDAPGEVEQEFSINRGTFTIAKPPDAVFPLAVLQPRDPPPGDYLVFVYRSADEVAEMTGGREITTTLLGREMRFEVARNVAVMRLPDDPLGPALRDALARLQ